MLTLSFLFLLLIFNKVTHSVTVDAPTEDLDHNGITMVDEEHLYEAEMREWAIGMARYQILSQVDFKEAPPSTHKPSETSREIIEILKKEEEERRVKLYDLLNNKDHRIIQANNISMRCLHSNDSSCKMFLYQLSPTFSTSAVKIWIYKMTEYPRLIPVSLYLSTTSEDKYYGWSYYEVGQVGWNKLSLPELLLPSSWNETFSFFVEVIGQNIEDYGDYRPKLMVPMSSCMPPRQRRDVTCYTNETCCFKPLKVNFTEIGFNWVVYPYEIEINMCLGPCRMDHGALRSHYERSMGQVLEKNRSLHDLLTPCLKLCCRPKTFEDFQIFYLDNKNVTIQSNIAGLKVKSCGCI